MKDSLRYLLEQALGLDKESPEKRYRTPEEQEIIMKLRGQLLSGSSLVKKALKDNIINMDMIAYAIKNKRCLTMPNRDLGTTYLSNTLSNAITDGFSDKGVDAARALFGLKPTSPEKEYKRKLRRKKKIKKFKKED